MSPKLLGLRKSLFALLALFMVLTAVQLGPGASSASAWVRHYCSPEWAIREIETNTGLNFLERCEPLRVGSTGTVWKWTFLRFKSATNNQRKLWSSGCVPNPGYVMALDSLMSNGSGGGAAAGGIQLFNCNYNPLNRTIGVRTIIQVQSSPTSSWRTCSDKLWIEAGTQRWWQWTTLNQGREPDCGAGYYRAQVAGRYWSINLNRWITSGWLYSPSMWLSSPVVATEPTITPTAEVTSLQ
jgi:hypothetical protein